MARLASAAVGEADGVDSAWRLHLTISRDDSLDSLETVREALAYALPVSCVVGDLCLARLTESGRVVTERR